VYAFTQVGGYPAYVMCPGALNEGGSYVLRKPDKSAKFRLTKHIQSGFVYRPWFPLMPPVSAQSHCLRCAATELVKTSGFASRHRGIYVSTRNKSALVVHRLRESEFCVIHFFSDRSLGFWRSIRDSRQFSPCRTAPLPNIVRSLDLRELSFQSAYKPSQRGSLRERSALMINQTDDDQKPDLASFANSSRRSALTVWASKRDEGTLRQACH
jgi:hypothetical protein